MPSGFHKHSIKMRSPKTRAVYAFLLSNTWHERYSYKSTVTGCSEHHGGSEWYEPFNHQNRPFHGHLSDCFPLPSPIRGGVSWQLHPGEVPRLSCFPGVCLATAGWTKSVWVTSMFLKYTQARDKLGGFTRLSTLRSRKVGLKWPGKCLFVWHVP